jgi:hypothetical protein
MKLEKMIFFIVLLTQNIFSQSLTDEYYNFMKPKWEYKITDEMRSNIPASLDSIYKSANGYGILEADGIISKNVTESKISLLKSILALDNFNSNDIETTISIERENEEPYVKGFVIYDNKFYFFQQNADKDYRVEKYSNYLKDYEKLDEDNSRSILFFLLKERRYDAIEKLIEYQKNNTKNEGLTPSVNYEIFNYNSKREKKLNIYHLNEYGTTNE